MSGNAGRPPVVALSRGSGGGQEPDANLSQFLAQVREALAPRYEVTESIGQGGMAVVFRARDVRHGRDVAVKVVRPDIGLTMPTERFLREIQVTAQLQHPNIVALFDSGTAGGFVYYVMPFVEGESLRSVLTREGPLAMELTLQLTRDVASALEYAHARGIVHRDIKPENILVSSGHAMLADFGIAGVLSEVLGRESLTREGVAIGTPAYMSPEQCSGKQTIDARSDIYSLGCVLYEMLAGEVPFTGRTPQAVMARHASDRVPSIQVVRPDIPPRLVGVTNKMLAKVPGDRFATASELLGALRRVEEPSRRMRPWVPLAGAAAVAAVALLTSRSPPRPLDPNSVAVFPLAEGGLNTEEQGAGAAVAVMIAVALEHADPLRPLDVMDHLTSEQRGEAASLTPSARREIARGMAARHYVTGIVQGHGDSITVGVRLYDVAGDSLVDQRSATGLRAGVALHRLGIDAVKSLIPALIDPGRTVDLNAVREGRPSAVALFVQGEREYRTSHFAAALALYERALAEDSSLVIAAIKGAQAAFWQDHHTTARLAAYAVARDSLLPPRYAAFARGLEAFAAGRADSAEAWLLKAIAAAPRWPEALMQLGEVYYHLVPLRASLDSLALVNFRAAAAADSGFSPPLLHLAEIAVRDESFTEARAFIERLKMLEPSPEIFAHLEPMYQCAANSGRGDWAALLRSEPAIVLRAARALSAGGKQLRCAESAFRSLLSQPVPSLHWGATFGLQAVLAAQSRTAEAVHLVDSVVNAGTLQVLMATHIVNLAAGFPVDSQARAVAVAVQARQGRDYAGLAANPRLVWLQWLMGVWHAREGEGHTVRSLQRALAHAQTTDSGLVALLAAALGGHVLLMQRDTAGAIARFRSLNPAVPSDSLRWSLAPTLAVERLQLAQLLLARGDYLSAIDVASVFDHPEPMLYVAFLPASLTIRIRASEALGRRAAADGYRSRLARLRSATSAD